jgi:hypothetical protein
MQQNSSLTKGPNLNFKYHTFELEKYSTLHQNSNTFLITHLSYLSEKIILMPYCNMLVFMHVIIIRTCLSLGKIKRQRACKMTKFTLGRKCPYCKDIAKTRLQRRFWMRLVLWTKQYKCDWCGCKYLSIFNSVSFRIT